MQCRAKSTAIKNRFTLKFTFALAAVADVSRKNSVQLQKKTISTSHITHKTYERTFNSLISPFLRLANTFLFKCRLRRTNVGWNFHSGIILCYPHCYSFQGLFRNESLQYICIQMCVRVEINSSLTYFSHFKSVCLFRISIQLNYVISFSLHR